MTLRLCLIAVLLPAVASGCSYFANRGRDLGDIISIGGSTGGGFGVRLSPTRLLAVDVGARKDEHFYGWHERHSQWEESTYGLFFASFWSPTLHQEPPPPWSGWDVIKTSHSKETLLDATPIEERKYHLFVLSGSTGMHAIEALDIDVTADALFGGIQIVVSPGQLLDFLAGIFALDLAGDDVRGDAPDAGAGK